MSYSFPQMRLSEAETLWLEEVYSRLREFEPASPRELRVNLWNRLPRSFDPYQIDRRLMLNPSQITLLGIWHIDPESDLIDKTDRIICCIRDSILKDHSLITFRAAEIAESTNIPIEEVAMIFEKFLHQLGTFQESATVYIVDGKHFGYDSISIGSERGFQQYMSYDGLEPLVEEFYRRLDPGQSLIQSDTSAVTNEQVYWPNSAFIMMWMDDRHSELEDVANAIKDVCTQFDIKAVRADDVEHQDKITDVVLEHIAKSEFLIADLTGERPNVYYEVGYAHSLRKRPILYRRFGTKLHFDLSVHNAPEYRNITDLKHLLTKRFEAILGRSPNSQTNSESFSVAAS